MRDLKEIAKLTFNMKSLLNKPSPVIGLLTKSTKDEETPFNGYREVIEPKYLYILNGAIVVPISLYSSRSEMKELVGKINGLCLPGGFSNIWRLEGDKRVESDHAKAGRTLLELALEANKNGVYFPILGICLGFELMVSSIGEDLSLIESCNNCTDYNTILQFTKESKSSRLLTQCFNKEQVDDLQNEPLNYNYHSFMVDPERFLENKKLTKFFNMVSTSPSSDNKFKFVSTIEAREFPFYAFQHHPEWCFYDFYDPKLKVISNKKTKDIGNAIGNFFLNEARKNRNVYVNKRELEENMIVNKEIQKVKIKGYTYFVNKS